MTARKQTVLDSDTRTATTRSLPISPPPGAKAAYISFDVSAVDTSDVKLAVEVKGYAAADFEKIFEAAASLTTVTSALYLIGANVAAASDDITEVEDRHLPQRFYILITHANANDTDYSVSITFA